MPLHAEHGVGEAIRLEGEPPADETLSEKGKLSDLEWAGGGGTKKDKGGSGALCFRTVSRRALHYSKSSLLQKALRSHEALQAQEAVAWHQRLHAGKTRTDRC